MSPSRSTHNNNSPRYGKRRSVGARAALALLLGLLLAGAARAGAGLPEVSVGLLKFGTVEWELATMQRLGLDRHYGFQLRLLPLASMGATRTALQSGAVDIIVADWLWVSAQRDRGQALQFSPYSAALGRLVVAPQAGIASLQDLRGKRIGVSGGALSKDWLLLSALARREGWDLAATTTAVYASPPLLNRALRSGQVDAVLTHWHYAARLQADGYRELLRLSDIALELDAQPAVALLGYVFYQHWAEQQPARVAGFVQAVAATKQRLASEPGQWEALRPLMRVSTAREFELLREGYLAGIPRQPDALQLAGAARLFALLADLGGQALMGDSTQLDRRSFWCELPACPTPPEAL